MTLATTITPFRALFVDIGGVLLTNGWDQQARNRAAERFALDRNELNERHHLTFDSYERGKVTLAEYLTRVVFHQDRPFTRQAFTDFMLAQSQPLPGMIELFHALKARHPLRITAISNEGRELTQHRIQAFDLPSIIDAFVCSCFVHLRKPDRDIYCLALDLGQLHPDEVVYIDDRAQFVEEAMRLGLCGVHHTHLDSTRQALESLGLTARGSDID